MPFYKHDLEDVLKNFCIQHNLTWAYAHYTNLEEEMYERETSLHEVKDRILKNKKATQRYIKPREMPQEEFIQGKSLVQVVDPSKQQEHSQKYC